ncbi:MAG TPA: HAMP domain-containing methyl-accepting chemotaxis protein [Myxococcota bacterium]
MRVALTHKFVLGSLIVGAAVVGLPSLLVRSGIDVASWVYPFIALGVGGIIGFFLSRALSSTFSKLRNTTERISRGDLTAMVDIDQPPRFPDETWDLACSIHRMAENLCELVEGVQAMAVQLTAAARETNESVHRARGGNDEISSSVAGLAEGVAEQQKLLEGTSRLVREIATAIEINASRAREAFGFAAEANQKAGSGVDVSRLAIEKMRNVFERVENAVARVFELEGKTQHVHQIIGIITSVAHRTNLLSLNASIEAARAGEAGRGFSVVADEIRKLAESAGRSAEEIAKLIHEIESDTSEVAEGMRESSMVIGEGREDVDTIAVSLEQIRSAVGEAARRAEEIFEGADTQAMDAQRMVESMDEIFKVAARNARSIEGVASTAHGQVEFMTQMVDSSRNLNGLAEKVRDLLRRFDTGRKEMRSES